MKKSAVIFTHIGFWFMIYYLVLYIMQALPFGLTASAFKDIDDYFGALKVVMVMSVPFYIFFFYTKLIIKNRKYIIYPIAASVLIYLLIVYLTPKVNNVSNVPIPDWERYLGSLAILVLILLFAFAGGMLQYFSDWFKKEKLKKELERKNYESTFALLRSQVNPHFLFNTLHNIDTLIHDNQQKASKSLVKLSDIMRYMLKEARLDFVELGKEIEHLENYLSLEKLRLKNDKFLDVTISGDPEELKIAPMLLIPFVENAFKHCVESSIENGIMIKIRIENKNLEFVCENLFDKSVTDKDKSHGIGLETVKKRLDLIYKNKHRLSINSENSVFKVNLEIELNEN